MYVLTCVFLTALALPNAPHLHTSAQNKWVESIAEHREHIQLLLSVSRWYYEDQLSQSTIASRIGYSRSSVSRLLTQARQRGIVRFDISHPVERHMALESALVERFGLRSARVTDSAVEGDPGPARAGAEVVVEAVQRATVLAVSAGTTVSEVAYELPAMSLRDLHVVQMIGALSRANPLVDSPDVTRRIAERLGGDYRQMPAPLIVGTPRLARELKKEESVANALALASHADVALVGIGAMDETGSSGPIFNGWISHAESRRLLAMGAVGHVSGHHFDAQGHPVVTDLYERVLSVPLERLRSVRTVIGVAAGEGKTAAIRGALLGGYINVFVTDAATAHRVLRQA
nr:sugar-binding transcriptional regulator [Dermatophilus congolensis]